MYTLPRLGSSLESTERIILYKGRLKESVLGMGFGNSFRDENLSSPFRQSVTITQGVEDSTRTMDCVSVSLGPLMVPFVTEKEGVGCSEQPNRVGL